MTTTVATDVSIDFSGYKIIGDIEMDASQHALFLAGNDEGPAEVISINLEAYDLRPQTDENVFIKDWSEYSGLTESLAKAGVVEILNEVRVGPFNSLAYEVKVVATKAGA